jgi:uncharacterized protein (DUF1501 family)
MNATKPTRRSFLQLVGGAGLAGLLPAPLAFAATGTDRYLMLVVLRGALDGLAAVVPYHERRLMALRRELVPPAPGAAGGALALGVDGFALHPSLSHLHESWAQGELALLHAAASPYRERSHFDGQDVLESGATRVYDSSSGWLNRALGRMPEPLEAAAVAPALPLVLRGDAHAVTWAPSVLPEPEIDTFERLLTLYEKDEALRTALLDARALDQAAGGMDVDAREVARGRSYRPLMESGAKLIASGAAGVVVLSLSGWDTHSNQGAGSGALAQRLEQLDDGLRAVQSALADKWGRTAVLVVTEFGRTVKVNGSRGSDHGTGGVAFLLGGAVQGGTIVGDWPGLSSSALYEGRDLYPANDLRSLFKGVLRDHLGVERSDLDRIVFPESATVPPMGRLIRA